MNLQILVSQLPLEATQIKAGPKMADSHMCHRTGKGCIDCWFGMVSGSLTEDVFHG